MKWKDEIYLGSTKYDGTLVEEINKMGNQKLNFNTTSLWQAQSKCYAILNI